MAKFRMVRTEFWNDPKVIEEMTPEDKYFFLYLLTNPNTTQIGIYQITKRQIAFDTGYSTDTVDSLLDRFINHHEILIYNTKTRELAIRNWGRYNLKRGGKPMLDCVISELKEVKGTELIKFVGERVEHKAIKALYDTYHDTGTTSPQYKEKEEEEEEEEDKEQEVVPYVEIIKYLNDVASKNYQTTTSKTRTLIKARWNEGFILDDFKKVIDTKNTEWKNNKDMSKYIRPETIFGPKFESYLNQESETTGYDPNNDAF